MENEQAKDSVYIKVGQCISASENTWYYVVRFLGKGGNGTAYLALCTAGKYVGSVFALKVFHRISSEERKKRFLEEVKLMQSNHHPAMVQQYDEGEWNGYPFVVMDYMPHTLATQIRSSKISIGLGLSSATILKHLLKSTIEVVPLSINAFLIFAKISLFSLIICFFGFLCLFILTGL